MTRIIMSGCNGAMGTTITKIVSEDAEAEIVAGIDIVDDGSKDYPVFSSIKDCDVEADAVIDFRHQRFWMIFWHTVKKRKCRLYCVRQGMTRHSWQRLKRHRKRQQC